MIRTSSAIRRWHWLIVLLAIGLVAALPIFTTANSCLVLAESTESLSDGEDVELDDSLNLIARLCSGPKLHSPGPHERVADESTSTSLVQASIHFERGPPLC